MHTGGDDATDRKTARTRNTKTMSENEHTPEEQQIKTIYGGDEAYVEDFRIRPVAVEDDRLKMHVKMRVGGAESIYYVSATATYAEDENTGHHISIHRVDGHLIDEFDTSVITASPSDTIDAVQALHEVYVQAADDWYDYARDAGEAGDGR